MPVTIKDVARESGVNISTVSRALNNGYGVNDQTREHVIAVAARLNYRPNRIARGLVTGRSHSLGLIVSDIRNPFFAEVARGAEDAARTGSCDLVLCNSDLDADKQMQYVQSLLEKRIDGIMMNSVSMLNREQQAQLAASGVPIVLLNRSASNHTFSTVCADNESGGALAARYLLGLGHRKIAHLTGPRQHGNLSDRTRGFVRALQSAKNPVQPIVLHGKFNFDGGTELTRKLLDEHPDVTAIFAANDVMAFGVVHAGLDRGIRIPEDLSLIGFDNIEFSVIVHPPLTTIHQPKYEMGYAAVDILLRLARDRGKQTPEHRLLGVELIERQSCQQPIAGQLRESRRT
ncbi:MAG TPA: LacI family DNA-binding transcriptional regulator [Candidatus Acidoferrales bacterium]|jgi:DNA-binding LacI/PurR family transcriptional regulator|nr:LacI family DNA-binding transcriptional regulator [Candidatus Acidoferrales bacterium]